jgi:hypothetical protein
LSSEQLSLFRQVVVELHWGIRTPYIYVPDFPVDILEHLLKTHQPVVVHPNNYGSTVVVDGVVVPQVIEVTLLRKSSYQFTEEPFSTAPFTSPNNPENPEIDGVLL